MFTMLFLLTKIVVSFCAMFQNKWTHSHKIIDNKSNTKTKSHLKYTQCKSYKLLYTKCAPEYCLALNESKCVRLWKYTLFWRNNGFSSWGSRAKNIQHSKSEYRRIRSKAYIFPVYFVSSFGSSCVPVSNVIWFLWSIIFALANVTRWH